MTDRRPAPRPARPARAARRLRDAAIAALLLAGVLPGAASAAVLQGPLTDGGATPATPTASTIALQKVVDLSTPVLAIGSGDGSGRLFVVQQAGRIRIVDHGNLLADPVPRPARPRCPTAASRACSASRSTRRSRPTASSTSNYTNRAGNTVIREFKASAGNPNVVDMASARTVLTIAQPYANHNGGMLAFGPDGYLYIGMGDGGSGGDPQNRAQNPDSLLGKMLRINVNVVNATHRYGIPAGNPYVGRAGRDEIWQRGLRNPWRFSFDRATGNLWIGDVGQGRYEEVDRVAKTSTGPGRGRNWGWRAMEGRHCFLPATGCNRTGKTLPMLEYSHALNGRCAISGGYVYRGTAIPALRGWYVFGDYCSGEAWAVSATAPSPATPVRILGSGSGPEHLGLRPGRRGRAVPVRPQRDRVPDRRQLAS